MRVLVTGGAGFIGSHVVDALLAAGDEVRVLDNLSPAAHRDPPGHLDPRADHRVGDVTDERVVGAAVAGVDAVCHQAARVGLGVDFGDAPGYVHDNGMGTAVLLRALFASGFRGPVVLAGSMVVYGEGRSRCPVHGRVQPGPRAEADLAAGRFDPVCPACGSALACEPVPESAPADPRNVYAATKLHQEHLCQAFGRETGCPVVVLRYHNVYGPRMPRDTPYAGVASIFRSALEAGVAPEVFEDGRQLRDFVHVADVARANLLALAGAAGGDPAVTGVFNVASGRPRTVGEMAEALADAFGPGAPRPVVTGRYRAGDVRHIVASPARAAAVLGFEAGVGFGEGMAELARASLR